MVNKAPKTNLHWFLRSCCGLGLLLAPVAMALPAVPSQPESVETQQPEPSEPSEPSAKITFDLSNLSAEGLTLQSQRAVDYEFCIPATEAHQVEVKAIDPSVQFMPHSRGRIGCRSNQVLCIGNTHQTNWREILTTLTELDYIERIDQTFWE